MALDASYAITRTVARAGSSHRVDGTCMVAHTDHIIYRRLSFDVRLLAVSVVTRPVAQTGSIDFRLWSGIRRSVGINEKEWIIGQVSDEYIVDALLGTILN